MNTLRPLLSTALLCLASLFSIPVVAASPQEQEAMTARVYGDTAVVQGITSLKGRSGGKPFAVDVRFTDTLVRVNGQWRIVVSHVTRIPTP